MRTIGIFAAATAAVLGLSACDVEQTQEGEAPDVDIDGGSLPEYDVDAADVDVGTEEQTVEVPTIDVGEADAGAPGNN
jgi:uncharacterized lipoprotein